jgi:hypothetical protein
MHGHLNVGFVPVCYVEKYVAKVVVVALQLLFVNPLKI